MLTVSANTEMPSATVLESPISDQTAMIKAKRFMDSLKGHSDVFQWFRDTAGLGFNGVSTPTNRWKTVLNFHQTQKEAKVFSMDSKGEPMAPGKQKNASMVILIRLAHEKRRLSFDGLQLIMVFFKRSKVLRPRGPALGLDVRTMMEVSLHSLQRFFQRGYGLTKEGELDYLHLTDVLIWIWTEASSRLGKNSPDVNEVTIDLDEARCVVARHQDPKGPPLVLVTVLPPRK